MGGDPWAGLSYIVDTETGELKLDTLDFASICAWQRLETFVSQISSYFISESTTCFVLEQEILKRKWLDDKIKLLAQNHRKLL